MDLDEANEKMQSPLHFAAFKQKTEATLEGRRFHWIASQSEKKHRVEAVRLMLAAGASTTSLDRKAKARPHPPSSPP